jgi:hypothetical protein
VLEVVILFFMSGERQKSVPAGFGRFVNAGRDSQVACFMLWIAVTFSDCCGQEAKVP